jgi:hypothetical protein
VVNYTTAPGPNHFVERPSIYVWLQMSIMTTTIELSTRHTSLDIICYRQLLHSIATQTVCEVASRQHVHTCNLLLTGHSAANLYYM